eukprot:TRINITY_DN10042_c0_g1_i3.p1 TRINITY_DN10042_c0_g1~~TRINITY_DN10042_c0_g1_i3.p1  ORF type:complete len:415 (-),score=33.74 TRINITY_DN10042_c0_g1_i3:363-1607(-)
MPAGPYSALRIGDYGSNGGKEDGDTAVLDHLRQIAPWLSFMPVFGNLYFQAFYVLVGLVAIAVPMVELSHQSPTLKLWLLSTELPETLWYGGGLIPFSCAVSIGQLVEMRRLLTSGGFVCLFEVVMAGKKSDTQDTAWSQRINNVLQAKGMLVAVAATSGLAGSCFWFVATPLVHVDHYLFYVYLLPYCVCMSISIVSLSGLKLVCDVCGLRVLKMRALLDELVLENFRDPTDEGKREGQLSLGFFRSLLQDYHSVDEELMRVFSRAVNFLLLAVSPYLVSAYLGAITASMQSGGMVGYIAGMVIVGSLACVVFMLYPIANISDMCHNTGTAVPWENESFRLRVLQIGAHPMSPEVRAEYNSLAHCVSDLKIGIKLPVLGLISGSDLVMVGKILVSTAPLAITYTVTGLEGEEN